MPTYQVQQTWRAKRELLGHGRRVGDEEKTEVRVVSGKTNLILHIETYQLWLRKTIVL